MTSSTSQRLSGKVAVITGTAGGQGRTAALLFAREGARIVGCDFKSDGSRQTAEMVKAAGGEMTSLEPLDLCDETDNRRLIDHAVEAYGGIDILYNNAGALRAGSAETISRQEFDFTLANEVTVVWLAVKHAIPVFRNRGGGAIINVGSIAGMTGSGTAGNARNLFAHAISKAAVIRMGSYLSVELAPLHVRVNTISPGIIDTPATHGLLGEDAGSPVRQAFLSPLLVKRIGKADDIANAALFLASDEASYITGVNLNVDGGWIGSGGLGQPSEEVERAFEHELQGLVTGGREVGERG